MRPLLSILFRILAFAVGITGLASLLNYLFDLRLTLEGTEAPAELEPAVMLVCFSVTLAMWGEYAAKTPIITRLTGKWYSVLLYFSVSVLLSVLPPVLFFQADKAYRSLYLALAEGRANEFRNSEKLKNLSANQVNRIFSEAIRRNNPEIARLVSEFVTDINGDLDSLNVFLAAYISNPEIFSILIAKGADFSKEEKFMGNKLIHSIISGKGLPADKITVLQMLKDKNLTDVHATDNFKATPLMYAAERGGFLVAEYLLQQKADPEQKDSVGNKALTRACSVSSLYPDVPETARIKTVNVLLRYGAIKNTRDYLGRSCYELAKEAGYKNIMKLFNIKS